MQVLAAFGGTQGFQLGIGLNMFIESMFWHVDVGHLLIWCSVWVMQLCRAAYGSHFIGNWSYVMGAVSHLSLEFNV